MAKVQKEQTSKAAGVAAEAKPKAANVAELTKKIVLNGADIVAIGPDAELLVGGKTFLFQNLFSKFDYFIVCNV